MADKPPKVTAVDVTELKIEPLRCPSCHEPKMGLVNPWPVDTVPGDPGFMGIGLGFCLDCGTWFEVRHGLN